MRIETGRLLLRPFDETDGDIIFDLYSDGEIMRYMPLPVMNRQMAQEHLEKVLAWWNETPRIHYEMAIVCRETGEKIGRAEITRNFPEDSAMVGWMLTRSAQGMGYGTETAQALVAYCFGELSVHRVYALCHPNNTASRRVMEKCGMHLEAHYMKKCQYTKAEGIRWEDETEYAIVREDVPR